MTDTSFKAYLKAITHGDIHMKFYESDKQFLKLIGFLILLLATLIFPFVLLRLWRGVPSEGMWIWVGVAAWWISWLGVFYIPWREGKK